MRPKRPRVSGGRECAWPVPDQRAASGQSRAARPDRLPGPARRPRSASDGRAPCKAHRSCVPAESVVKLKVVGTSVLAGSTDTCAMKGPAKTRRRNVEGSRAVTSESRRSRRMLDDSMSISPSSHVVPSDMNVKLPTGSSMRSPTVSLMMFGTPGGVRLVRYLVSER